MTEFDTDKNLLLGVIALQSDLIDTRQFVDGRLFPVEVSLSPVRTEQGLLVSCAVRDVSSRTSLE